MTSVVAYTVTSISVAASAPDGTARPRRAAVSSSFITSARVTLRRTPVQYSAPMAYWHQREHHAVTSASGPPHVADNGPLLRCDVCGSRLQMNVGVFPNCRNGRSECEHDPAV